MNTPKFISIPVVQITKEGYYQQEVEEIEAEMHGNNRERIQFENKHAWYEREEITRIEPTLIKLDLINCIRPTWDGQWSIVEWGEQHEYVVPISVQDLDNALDGLLIDIIYITND